MFSLINFMGIDTGRWETAFTKGPDPLSESAGHTAARIARWRASGLLRRMRDRWTRSRSLSPVVKTTIGATITFDSAAPGLLDNDCGGVPVMNTLHDHALHRHSLAVILDNQQPSGAYLACPTMPDYQFSWFRDGAFIAYALTLDGWQANIKLTRATWDRSGTAPCGFITGVRR